MNDKQREEIRSVLMNHSNGVTNYDPIINEIARILSPQPAPDGAEEVWKEIFFEVQSKRFDIGMAEELWRLRSEFEKEIISKALHTHAANEVAKAVREKDEAIAKLEKELAEKDKSEPEIKLPTDEEIRSYFADVNFLSMYIPAAQWLRDEVKRLNGIK